ncbi:hypothetical protein PV05_02335 [Exophiala xenobiotica]|uniref:Transmembrane protein n=1 Tax=Exophiala xenobiotica TaxID=348802 RepID=A0A0D2ESR1_9EURO|nr:uncharacterized protein PV05_02335 [Exophiala xenobiotica]KIW57775.1 hypothetical protein PV05_02335 [Exophiala xenobiotica]
MSAQDEANLAASNHQAPAPPLIEGDSDHSKATGTSSALSLDQNSHPQPVTAATSHDAASESVEDPPHGASAIVTISTKPAQDPIQSRKTLLFAWFERTFSDSWIPEIGAIVFSILCLVAIVVTLAVFNNKPRPQLVKYITFNTIISILATGTRSSLIYVTAATLGQKKWTWFRSRPRRLRDVQAIDEASRGPLVPSANASARRATFIPDLGRSTVAQDAVALGTFSDYYPRNPACPSRNCTWPDVRSVGWCSQCEDVTSQAKIIDCDHPLDWNVDNYTAEEYKITNCKFSLPSFEPVSSLVVNASTTVGYEECYSNNTCRDIPLLDGNDSDATGTASQYELQQRMVLQMYEIVLAPVVSASGCGIASAVICSVSPCMNTYSISVQDSQEHTKLVDSQFYQSRLRKLASFGEDPSESPLEAATCFEFDDTLKKYSRVIPWPSAVPSFVDVEHEAFCIFDWRLLTDISNYTWASPLGPWVDPIVSAISATVSVAAPFLFYDSGIEPGSTFVPTPSGYSFIEHILSHGGLPSALTNISHSLTSLNLEYSTETVSGSLVEQVVFVHVRWCWITLPAILVAAAAVSLVMAILETRSHGAELWKDSTLALLYHGIAENVIDSQKLYSKTSEIDKAAQAVDVQLTTDDNSGRLLLRPQNRPGKA